MIFATINTFPLLNQLSYSICKRLLSKTQKFYFFKGTDDYLLTSGLIFPSWFRSNILPNIPFIAVPPLIVHVFIVIGFTGKQDIFTIYQSHVTITSVKTFHYQLLHFFEFYDLIFFDGYSVYQ